MASWPSTLKFNTKSVTRKPNKLGVRYNASDDGGSAYQRRNATLKMWKFGGDLICNRTQYSTFVDFYYGDAEQGGAWFDMTDPISGNTCDARFVFGQEPEEKPYLVDDSDTGDEGMIIAITITLELREQAS